MLAGHRSSSTFIYLASTVIHTLLFYLLSFSEDVLTVAPVDGGSWISRCLTSQSYLLLHL